MNYLTTSPCSRFTAPTARRSTFLRINLFSSYVLLVVSFQFSVASHYSRQSRNVHPKWERHQPVVPGKRDARASHPFHLVQGSERAELHQSRLSNGQSQVHHRNRTRRPREPPTHPQRHGSRFRQLHLHSGRRRACQHRRSRPQWYSRTFFCTSCTIRSMAFSLILDEIRKKPLLPSLFHGMVRPSQIEKAKTVQGTSPGDLVIPPKKRFYSPDKV